MADPLAALAEREVPERTNFFDPRDAERIIARYGNARAERDVLDEVAKSDDRRMRLRDDEERLIRDRVTWDRADEEYADRQSAKQSRGQFLRDMQKVIDPASADYTRQVVEFKAGLPPELQDDDVINSLLTAMNQEADDYRSQRNAEVSKQQTLKNQQAMFREKAQYGPAFQHINEKDIAAHKLPDGSPDLQALYVLGNERSRAYKEGEFDRKLKAVNEGRVRVAKAMDLSTKGKSRRAAVEKFITNDTTAFPPSRVSNVLAEYAAAKGKKGKVNPVGLEVDPEWGPKLEAAKRLDANPLESELSYAFAYDDPDDYIKLAGDKLTDTQKERRRRVWDHAHKDEAIEEVDAAPAAAPRKTKVINGVTYEHDGKGWLKIGD